MDDKEGWWERDKDIRADVVFVPCPTERESVAQGLFLVGPGAGP